MSSPKKIEPCDEHKVSIKVDERDNKYVRLQRAQWLRAAILGANDGLLTTTSLMLGISAAKEDQRYMILSGLAGALAGASSMAVGEFVSVSTQRDIERAVFEKRVEKSGEIIDDVTLKVTLGPNPSIGKSIGYDANAVFSPKLSPLGRVKCADTDERASPCKNSPVLCSSPVMKVVISDVRMNKMKLSENNENEDDAEDVLPNPYKAAGASAGAFICGSAVPLVPAIYVADNTARLVVLVIVTSIALAVFGGIGARLGGSSLRASAVRVLLGGWISMAITYCLLKSLDRDDIGKEKD